MRYRLWIPLALMLLAGLSGGLWWALHAPANAPHDPPPDGPPWFADITDQAGLHFVHDADAHGKYLMPEIFGSGARCSTSTATAGSTSTC